MKLLFVLLTTLWTFGCEFDNRETESDDLDSGESTTRSPYAWNPSSLPVNESPSESNGTGEQIFLWKPISESSGNLVILVPAVLSTAPIGVLTVNDTVRGRYTSIANGNRAHYRFEETGSFYGENIPVVLVKNGIRHEWIIPNGASRYTERYP